MTNEHIPWLIRGYLRGRNGGFGRPIDISDAGAGGIRKFGKQMIAMGASLLVLCVFLPRDSWLPIFIVMGIVTIAVGAWHVANADTIVHHARAELRHTREI